MIKPTKITIALVVLAAAMVGYGGTRVYKLSNYPEWLNSVQIGDTTDQVIRKMGNPDVVQSRPHYLWCNIAVADCDSEFMYGHSIPPEWWVVGFNRDGRVVLKTELQSP